MVVTERLSAVPLTALVSAYREAAEACARAPYPTERWNKASDAMLPVIEEVNRRGSRAIRELLPLLDHDEEWVRLSAARECYAVAPDKCREVLLKMFHDVSIASSAAILILLGYEPAFKDYFMAFSRSTGSAAERARAAKELTGYPTAAPR